MKNFIEKTYKILIFILLFGFTIHSVLAINTTNKTVFQDQIILKEVKGIVVDDSSKKPLVFATLNLLGSNISTITNTEGNFILKIPATIQNGQISVSFLGFESKTININELTKKFNTIFLKEASVDLQEVNLMIYKDASKLVKEVFQNKAHNYFTESTIMTAFYRESIKKRNRNVSLTEAVVNIYKTPYNSKNKDAIRIFKARKSTDYKRLDTVAFKLQGGPFNSLFLDIVKYPEYFFDNDFINYYDFSFDRLTEVNNVLVYIIKFKQKDQIKEPLYQGQLFIEPQNKILVSAVYSLNITNDIAASKLFVKRKPRNAFVYPKEVVYRIDYKESNGKWHYSYGNAMMRFKIKWDKKLFNTIYSMNCEMAVTDWQQNLTNEKPNKNQRMKSTIILSEEASGFSDPNFWGEHNIIEPEKNIESAIKKIQKQIEKTKNNQNSFSAP